MDKTTEPSRNAATEKTKNANKSNPPIALPAANLLFQAPDLSHFATPNDGPAHEAEEKATRKRSRSNRTQKETQSPNRDTTEKTNRSHQETVTNENKKRSSGTKQDGNGENGSHATSQETGSGGDAKLKYSRNVKPELGEASNSQDGGTDAPTRRRRRRTRSEASEAENEQTSQVQALEGSTRLEAKRIRRKAGRKESRKRVPITESEFLARRDSVKREMVVRGRDGLNQVALLEDGLLVEHYVSRHTQTTMVGNIYLGKVQNVLSSMEAAFVDIGKGRNAVLYAGEVNWDAAGLNSKTARIEDALNPGDMVLVQVTKDPIGHKGARLTSQITLAGRHLVLVPSGAMTGISRKLPDEERKRLKTLLKTMIPTGYGVIVRTAAEDATEEQLKTDVQRLVKIWEEIEKKRQKPRNSPQLLHAEPELAVRVVRDIFNEDISSLTIQGDEAWRTISKYVRDLSPELADRLRQWKGEDDVFAAHRIDEQLAKGFERKVWLPSGGYLIIDRTEAMTVIDVNTGRYIGAGGTLEETVTKNNLEAAEEIVRQLRLRDIGGIVVIDFVDMVIESNRDLVLRRLVECLGRDRTRHQVTEVTSLGLVQMTRKRVGQGLVEAFSTQCECCDGRGFIVHDMPVENNGQAPEDVVKHSSNRRTEESPSRRSRKAKSVKETKPEVRQAMAGIAAAAHVQEDTDATVLAGGFGEEKTAEGSDSPVIGGAEIKEAQSPARRQVAKGRVEGKKASGANRTTRKQSLDTTRLKVENLGESEEKQRKTTRRRHRRAVSTGVINTDAHVANIVVSGE